MLRIFYLAPENGLDVQVLLHDNDSTWIKVARIEKNFFRENPDCGMDETVRFLCQRHGSLAGKEAF